MDFDVSADGMGVTRFRATNIPGDTCTFGEIEVNFNTPVPIENHSFSRQVSNGLSFDGTFPSPASSQGTLKAHQNAIPLVQPACDSGIIPWSATTSAQPTPSPSASPTPTPTPSPTPSPGPSATLTISPSPTATQGAGQRLAQGDIDCDETVGPLDSLKELLDEAQLAYAQDDPCPDIGATVDIADASAHLWGDVDCDGDTDAADAVKLLQFVLDLPYEHEVPCPTIGLEVVVTET